uniref:MSP domain-containing protein n=1 Tax=Panagrellus redivivus TaxID=6233 RepID=A0A7E4UT84_PANRE
MTSFRTGTALTPAGHRTNSQNPARNDHFCFDINVNKNPFRHFSSASTVIKYSMPTNTVVKYSILAN